jgi:hypothetical protein
MSTPEDTATGHPQQPVDDANDLRGFHFKRLMGKRATWLWAGIPTVAIAIGLSFGNPIWARIILILGALITLIVVFAIATSRAKQDFFETYAQQRGMVLGGRGSLPPVTPLLSKGDDRYAEQTFTGSFADGIQGTLALYTYEEESTDSEGNRETSYYRYTLGLLEVPECATAVPELYCQRKFGFRALEKFEDVFRGSKDRVKLESEALDKKYEIFADEKQDANWLRQLFSPTFIVWLTDEAPKKFAFELVDGTLCCYVDGHKDSAADLDLVRAASASVATRLREEALE